MKKCMKLLCCVLVAICFTVSASAAEFDSSANRGVIDLFDIENNPDIIASDIMTFSEMVERCAENEGITYEEALQMFPNIPEAQSTQDIYYQTFSVVLNVTDGYKPHLEFFCEVAGGGHFWHIQSIYHVELVRSYGSISKQFVGTVNYWLRSGYSIEYSVNGDFYDNGSTTATGTLGVQLGLDELGALEFSFGGGSVTNYYSSFYIHTTAKFGAG